jgi:hypothetical protein
LSSSGSRRFSRLTWSFFGNRGPRCRTETIQRQLPSNPFSNSVSASRNSSTAFARAFRTGGSTPLHDQRLLVGGASGRYGRVAVTSPTSALSRSKCPLSAGDPELDGPWRVFHCVGGGRRRAGPLRPEGLRRWWLPRRSPSETVCSSSTAMPIGPGGNSR